MFSRFMGLFSGHGDDRKDNPNQKPDLVVGTGPAEPIGNPLPMIQEFLTGGANLSDNELFRAFMGLKNLVTEHLNAANESGGDQTAATVGEFANQINGVIDKQRFARLESLCEDWVSMASRSGTGISVDQQQNYAGTGMTAAYFCATIMDTHPELKNDQSMGFS